MTGATQTTIDDRPYATWKRKMLMFRSRWFIRSALPRGARTFAPEIVAAAEAAVYAKERAAVLAYKGLRELVDPPEAGEKAEASLLGNDERREILVRAGIREEVAAEAIDAGDIIVQCSGCANPIEATILDDLAAFAEKVADDTRR